MTTCRYSVWPLIGEFWQALGNPYTYSLHRNVDAVFGFLWGLPIPFFTLAIHIHAGGMVWSMATAVAILRENPIYLPLLAHPLIFAVIFGALGSIRLHRDAQIKVLIADLERHCVELSKSNEKLTELDLLKNQFLANVTHELKSPLVTALGYSERMLAEKLGAITARQRQALEVGKRNLLRLRSMIDEILDFSRLHAGIGRFNFELIDLNQVLQSAVNDKRPRAHDRQIKLTAELPATPMYVRGDSARLTQAVENLLENAFKFSPPCTNVRLAIRHGSHWHISISDEGPGIPFEMMPRLFQPFSQADMSAARPYNGVGLGLVIVKKIVEEHGGTVWLESQVGVGTTAHITLPKALAAVSAPEEVAHAANSNH